jgi:hypothetical protein
LTPPRLFGITAQDAPVVAVIRRGPSDWSHVGRWDVERGVYEPGSWIKANLYPQRADLSPDGRWLCYFTLKGPGSWPAGWTYLAVSRLPWLTALAAWGTCGTWTRGAHFVADRGVQELGVPDAGTVGPLSKRFGLALNRPTTFAVERRRGWSETTDTPPRADTDVWDEQRADRVVMQKPRTRGGDEVRLTVRGRFAAFRDGPFRGEARVADYSLVDGASSEPLVDVQWAEWDERGRLLVATTDGRLQVRERRRREFVVVHDVDLARFRPDPHEPPRAAREW